MVKPTAAMRTQARWLLLHGATRTLSTVRARRGHPVERWMFEPGARFDPYPRFEEIRALGRIVPTPLMHATTDHAIVSGALRDSQSFGVALGDADGMPLLLRWAFRPAEPDIASVVDAPSLLAVDPPTHTRYRRLVSKPFTPRALQKVADKVEERAAELLELLAGKREVDIIAEYADLLPVAVITEILGVPADMHEQFLAWGHSAAPVLDIGLRHRDYVTVNRSLKAMNHWFDEHFANLRRKPGDDILSQLVNADKADRLTDLELRATALLLLGAGFETTVNLLGSGVAVLGADEKARARLAADPEMWPQAIEELLRLESPVQLTARVARQDVEIDGVTITSGTPLLCLLGAANRDPAVFANPNVYDLDRPNSRDHVAFSAGIHYCLGANLAKLEGQIGLRLLFERYPNLRVLQGGGRRRDLQSLRGYESLWVDLGGVVAGKLLPRKGLVRRQVEDVVEGTANRDGSGTTAGAVLLVEHLDGQAGSLRPGNRDRCGRRRRRGPRWSPRVCRLCLTSPSEHRLCRHSRDAPGGSIPVGPDAPRIVTGRMPAPSPGRGPGPHVPVPARGSRPRRAGPVRC